MLPYTLFEDDRGQYACVEMRSGDTFLIDASDLDVLADYDWRPLKNKRCQGQHTYVYRYRPEKPRMVLLHRVLLDAPPNLQGDHRDGNGLNDRRYNIRLATKAQNTANNHFPSLGPSKSGFRGVYETVPGSGRWTAIIRCGGKMTYLGTFDTPEEAARARDTKAIAERGEFTYLNFPVTPR